MTQTAKWGKIFLFSNIFFVCFRILGESTTTEDVFTLEFPRSASSSRIYTIRWRRITCCWIGQSEQPLWFELPAADGRSLLRSLLALCPRLGALRYPKQVSWLSASTSTNGRRCRKNKFITLTSTTTRTSNTGTTSVLCFC